MTIEIDAVFGGGYGEKSTHKFEDANKALEFIATSVANSNKRGFELLEVRLPAKPKIEVTADLIRDAINSADFGTWKGVGAYGFVQELETDGVFILPGVGHAILRERTKVNAQGVPEFVFSVGGKLFRAEGRLKGHGTTVEWEGFKNLKEVTLRKVVTNTYE